MATAANTHPSPLPPNASSIQPSTAKQQHHELLRALERAESRRTNRLGLPLGDRVVLAFLASSLPGFLLGAAHGSRTAGLRFRAENAHRLPTSQKGWYFYHKSKNYAAMLGGARSGVRMAARLGFWATGYVLLEAAADHARNGWEHPDRIDFASSALAGVVTATLWGWRRKVGGTTTLRMVATGARWGVGFGLAQDLLGVLRGRDIYWVELGRRLLGGRKEREPAEG